MTFALDHKQFFNNYIEKNPKNAHKSDKTKIQKF